MSRSHARAVVLLICAMCLFSMVPNFLRYLVGDAASGGLALDVWIVNATRYSVAALFWLPVVICVLWRCPAAGRGAAGGGGRMHRTAVLRDAVVPTIVNALGQVLWGLAPAYVESSIIGFVMRLSFLFTVFYGFVFFADERRLATKKRFWLGVLATCVGLVLLSWPKLVGSATPESVTGMLILFGATVIWGGYAVSVKKFMAPYSSVLSFGVISVYTTAILIVLMLCVGDLTSLRSITPWAWGIVVLSALVGITFTHVLLYAGIKRLGAIVASGVMMVSPFLTLAVAVWVLHEKAMTGWQFLGGIVIVAGGGLLVWAKAKLSAAAAPTSAGRAVADV